jgi:hypothetical protein
MKADGVRIVSRGQRFRIAARDHCSFGLNRDRPSVDLQKAASFEIDEFGVLDVEHVVVVFQHHEADEDAPPDHPEVEFKTGETIGNGR